MKLGTLLKGTLMALLDHLDYHVLVTTSLDELAEKVEALGERNGVDMYFHGECVQTSDDFLHRCEFAKLVIITSRGPNYDSEVSTLVKLGKSIVLSHDLMKFSAKAPGISFIDDSNAMDVCKALKALHPTA
jgi:hypothetical protein